MRDPTRFCFLFSFLLFILSHQTSPQTNIPEGKIHFKHLTREQGLSDSFNLCILQDNKGFMWIGTSDGLDRYDGRRIKVYKHSPDNVNSLGANVIKFLYEDKSGVLWVGTGGGGLNKYNCLLENFTRYISKPNDLFSISSNVVSSIYEDKSGTLWIGTQDGGLNKFNRENEQFICFKNKPEDPTSLSNNSVTSIYEDSKGNLWIGTTGGGLNKFDRINQTFTRFIHNPDDPSSLSHDYVTGICEDNFGVLWISTNGGGLNKVTYKNNLHHLAFIRYKHNPNNPASLNDNDIANLYIDKNNIIWIGTWGGGLIKMIPSLNYNFSPSFVLYEYDPLDPFSLNNNNVSCTYEDNSGLLWIGTWGGGVHITTNKKKPFKHYKTEPNDPFSLSAKGVTTIYEDRSGILWVGTWDSGLNKWDRVANKFTHYKHNPGDPTSLSDNTVSAIYEDRSGILWIGTYNGGLNKFDKEKEKFYKYRHNQRNPKSISDDRVLAISEDQSGTLWIGTYYGGLNKFEKKSETFSHFKHNAYNLNSPGDNMVAVIYEDRSAVLWIGTKFGGLDALDYRTEKFIHYRFDMDNSASSSPYKINSIYEDKSGIIWVGTQDRGLIKLNKETGQFKGFMMKDGLPNDYVLGILEDDSGNLWLSTNYGLSKFNPLTETFRNYDVEDGLQSNEFEELSSWCKSKTGELIFGGTNGFNIFYPDSIKDNPNIPPIVITDFYLFNEHVPIGYDSLSNRSVLKKSVLQSESIELNYDDKILSFEFAALDFHSPEKNRYAYIMEGFDKDWTYTDANRRLATYTNLDPGEYIFRVRGSNNDGIWNEKGASIKIIILPPWWRTTWAYIFYAILIGSILYFTWKMQLKRIKVKHEFEMSRFEAQKLHEVDEMKSRFFTNISHEFRTPLTLILGPAKDILEKTKESETKQNIGLIRRNAGRLLGLVNQLLDLSKLEAGRMKLETREENTIPLLKGLVLSFSSLAERKKITLRFSTIEENVNVYLDREKIEKITNNLLSNAFKFTPDGGKIDVEIVKLSKEVKIKISDSGIGIPKENLDKVFDRFYQVDGSHTREQEGTGIGLALTKELVELHKGKIEVESETGKGTTFIVKIPMGKDHLTSEEIVEDKMKKEVLIPEDKAELISEGFIKKGKTDINVLLETDKPLLLVVEDNSDVRKYIISHLEDNYRIQEADDGVEGLEQAFNNIPDLIISDLMMPKMDGFEMCNKLKTDERTSHIPIIMLTAKATSQDKISGYETGADDYIMKPFDAIELKVRVKNLIDQRIRLHEHFKKEGLFNLEGVKVASIDKKFLSKAGEIINAHIPDTGFSVDRLADEIGMSRSQLHRKLINLIGESPGDLIRRIRLIKAAKLIEQKFGNISEVALEVGFSNPANFAQSFRKQFGLTPMDYGRKLSH